MTRSLASFATSFFCAFTTLSKASTRGLTTLGSNFTLENIHVRYIHKKFISCTYLLFRIHASKTTRVTGMSTLGGDFTLQASTRLRKVLLSFLFLSTYLFVGIHAGESTRVTRLSTLGGDFTLYFIFNTSLSLAIIQLTCLSGSILAKPLLA